MAEDEKSVLKGSAVIPQEDGVLNPMETTSSKYLALKVELRAIETKLRSEMEKVRSEWTQWALTHAGNKVGKYEGVFASQDVEGKTHVKTVLVHLEYDNAPRQQLRLQRMLIINEAGAATKTGAEMSLGSYAEGNVVEDVQRSFPRISKYPFDSCRTIMWGGIGSIDFDKQTQEHPESAPNFAAIARQELGWLKQASGILKSSQRYY
jgi:hypothetical protein